MKAFKTALVILGAVIVTAIVGQASAETTLERAKSEGVVRIGFSNESPWSFSQTDGSIAGADYDIVVALMNRIGIKTVDGVLVKFGSLIPGLKAKRFDLVVSGMYIRPARCEEIAFSEPIFQTGEILIVKKGNPLNLHSFADVAKNPKLKVSGVQGGATIKNARLAGIPDNQTIEYPDFTEAIFALKSGRVDGAVQNSTTAIESVEADSGKTIEIAKPWTPPIVNGKPLINYAGYGIRKDDKDLLSAVNDAWKALKGSPEHLEILKKYKFSTDDIPPDSATTADTCKQ